MPGFKSKYDYAVDEKGRISIPAKIRKNLSDAAEGSFVVTRGLDGCLYLYPGDTWLRIEQDMLSRLNAYEQDDRAFLRLLYSYAHDTTLDKQSRVMIPQELLDIAGITGSVVLIGQPDHIELWNPERHAEYMSKYEPHYDAIAARAMGNR